VSAPGTPRVSRRVALAALASLPVAERVSASSRRAGAGILLVSGPAGTNSKHQAAQALSAVGGALRARSAAVVAAEWPGSFAGFRSVVLFCEGGRLHPLSDEGRLQALSAHVAAGGGLVVLHSAMVLEGGAGQRLRSWLGGGFTPERSTLPEVAWPAAVPRLPAHPVTRGLRPFTVEDEWFLGLEPDPAASGRLTRVLTATPSEAATRGPLRPELLAWTYERPAGGRSFAFAGGHYRSAWQQPDIVRLLANAALWTAGLDVT
jgi:type 1 glutamine amidotransferase